MIAFKYLTEQDRQRYCKASCDLETGHYLMTHRSNDELQAIQDIIDAENATDPTERQIEILEWKKVCSDHDYAKDNGYIDEDGHFKI